MVIGSVVFAVIYILEFCVWLGSVKFVGVVVHEQIGVMMTD